MFINDSVCTAAVAVGAASLLLNLKLLVSRSSSVPEPYMPQEPQSSSSVAVLPVVINNEGPRPSLKMTHKQLLKLAQERKCGSAKFRSRARKIELVQALPEQEAA